MAGTTQLARRLIAFSATGVVITLAILSSGFTGKAALSNAGLRTITARPATATGGISGTVTNANGSVTLSGICVVVDTGGGGPSPAMTHTSSGTYTLSNLHPGMYVIR